MHKNRYIILIHIAILLVCNYSFSQTKKTEPKKKKTTTINIKQADYLTFDKSKSDAQILKGNVICEHEGALLYCDSALLFSSKRMEAGGNIRIVKGDSITVTGDKLFYDANTKLAALEGNVVCVEKDMTLKTPILTFDITNSIASYYNGGTIVNKDNTLSSKNGHYYSSGKDLYFHYDVELVNPDYKMKSDTLRYNVSNKTSYFYGPSIIISKEDYIYCENGYYNTDQEIASFNKNALLVTKNQKLRGDSLYYDRLNQFGKAYNNVSLVDTSQKSILYGNYIEYHQKNSEAFVTDKALYAYLFEKDTLFLHADTLFHKDIDSVTNYLRAFRNVKIFKTDLQAVCDSANFNGLDSLLKLYNNPIIWSNNSQGTGSLIQIKMAEKSIRSFELIKNAFLINNTDTVNKKYNQMSCQKIEAFFENDTIRSAFLRGNVEMLYYVKNENKWTGLNNTICSQVNAYFKIEEIHKTTLLSKPKGTIKPMLELKEEDLYLKGFNWMPNKRPKSKSEVFDN
ncbi:MAG: OstA-like protein [Bacteroidia bacterium]